MTSSTIAMPNGRTYSKHRWQIISVAGIACGAISLLAGIGLIFTFSVIAPNRYFFGLWVGAALCALGACFLVASVGCLCKWQAKLGKISIQVEENNDNANSVSAIEGRGRDYRECEFSHVLKKANSTAFISFGPSSQLDKLTLVGVLHGTLSATEIRKPSRKQLDMLNTFNYDLLDPIRPCGGGIGKNYFARDALHSRRSLPRFVFHPFAGKTLSSSERVPHRSGSEGRQLENMQLPRTAEPNIDQSPSPDESQLPDETTLNEVTHTTGQVSLFNLPAALSTSTGQAVYTNMAHSTQAKQSGQQSGLERSSSGKRFLLMNQSGQVISCTTLFDDDDVEDEHTTHGCRRLQPCSGLNFFPVFVENEGWASGSALDETDAGKDTERLRSCTTLTCGQNPKASKPHRGLFVQMRRFLRHIFKGGKTSESQREEADQLLLSEPTNKGESSLSRHRSDETLDHVIEPKEPKHSKLTFFEIQSNHASTEDTDSQTSNQARSKRKHTVVSNASVFSLPAVPPDKWLTERPLWIMGVPVETCDLVLLSEQDQALSNSTEHMKPATTTGSTSSIYAFHVRPPARLKQPAVNHGRCGRARSLGRFLNTDKL